MTVGRSRPLCGGRAHGPGQQQQPRGEARCAVHRCLPGCRGAWRSRSAAPCMRALCMRPVARSALLRSRLVVRRVWRRPCIQKASPGSAVSAHASAQLLLLWHSCIPRPQALSRCLGALQSLTGRGRPRRPRRAGRLHPVAAPGPRARHQRRPGGRSARAAGAAGARCGLLRGVWRATSCVLPSIQGWLLCRLQARGRVAGGHGRDGSVRAEQAPQSPGQAPVRQVCRAAAPQGARTALRSPARRAMPCPHDRIPARADDRRWLAQCRKPEEPTLRPDPVHSPLAVGRDRR
jgi:hypothetical protein